MALTPLQRHQMGSWLLMRPTIQWSWSILAAMQCLASSQDTATGIASFRLAFASWPVNLIFNHVDICTIQGDGRGVRAPALGTCCLGVRRGRLHASPVGPQGTQLSGCHQEAAVPWRTHRHSSVQVWFFTRMVRCLPVASISGATVKWLLRTFTGASHTSGTRVAASCNGIWRSGKPSCCSREERQL